ncbi:MAG: DUF4465 domain-containing protein [Chitinophagaceae bacterium]|nr:DUF4465 domain-containing protein [Chitinophagaceae bacterium]
MKKLFSLFMVIGFSWQAHAQYLVNFENLNLPSANTYWRGQNTVPLDSFFITNYSKFPNSWDTTWGGVWSGWGFSNKNDTTSIDYFTNELASIAGGAYNDTAGKYAVAYQSWNPAMNSIKLPPSWPPMLAGSCRITNTTIAYRSMQNGDGFAKKFGGVTGNDPDFFKIRFYGWLNGNPSNGTPVDFYLADFRDTNHANDYIVKDWKLCSLMPLGIVDSISYTLHSSDTSAFGINTPTYFCLDQLAMIFSGIEELPMNLLQAYPVPMNGELVLNNQTAETMLAHISDLQGRSVFQGKLAPGQTNIAVRTWASGTYFLQLEYQGKRYAKKLSK